MGKKTVPLALSERGAVFLGSMVTLVTLIISFFLIKKLKKIFLTLLHSVWDLSSLTRD